jgi:hypothetical protein
MSSPELSRLNRRVPRANVKNRQPSVTLTCPELGPLPLKVGTIAELGAGVQTSSFGFYPDLGRVMEAQLEIGFMTVPVQACFVYVDDEICGLEFVDPEHTVRQAIRNVFEAELLGAAMVKTELEQPLKDGSQVIRLSHPLGSDHCTITALEDEVLEFEMDLRLVGHPIRWSRIRGEKTGLSELTRIQRRSLTNYVRNLQPVAPLLRTFINGVINAIV